ncbi:hypothetical protein CMK22_06040 [Candidatus Poribacteria bacterium]|nr:hypothetical protein [Candidatus Poribacteria bacterium]
MSKTILYSTFVLMLSVIYLATVEAADKTLILHLPFDEGSGKKAADKSSYGHHAELIANYKWVPGKFGKAVEIANKQSADNIKTKEANTLKIEGEITKMAWVKVTKWTGNLMTVIGKNNHNGGEHSSYGFGLTGQGAGIQAFFGTGKSRPTLNKAVKLEAGKWMHVAASYDGVAMKGYIDGKLAAEQKEKFSFKGINDAPVRIGCAKDRARYHFHGAIDEVVIYSRALNEKEIQGVMKGSLLAPVTPKEKLSLTWGKIKN